MTKGGYKFVQVLLPVKTHRSLTDVSRKLHQSNAETVRNAIENFLKDSKSTNSQCLRGDSNDRNDK